MKPARAKLDFILRFVEEYQGTHGREACVKAAGALLRLAKRRRALAMAECNPPDPWKRYADILARRKYEDWEASIVRRRDKLLQRVHDTCAPFKLTFESQGDPRGHCIKVLFPSMNGARMGVPT